MMRVSEPINEPGYFWLPEKPEVRLPGTLHISEDCEIRLETIGVFGESVQAHFQSRPLNRVVGIIKNSYVTLDTCYYVPRTINFGGISQSVIKASCAYVEVAYDTDEAITFSKFQFSVEGLDEWLGITGITVEHNWDTQGGSIQYTPPSEIPIQLPDGIKLQFTFGWTLPGGGEVIEAKITQKAYITLTSSTHKPVKDFIALSFKINNFLCFAIDKTLSIDSATGYSGEYTKEGPAGKHYPVPIKIYYQSIPTSEFKPHVEWHNMLFRYGHIAQKLEPVLINWLANYQTSEPAFNLFFASKSGAHKYIDGRFLSLAQGIETLHRRNSTNALMPEEEFTELVNTLLDTCPSDKMKWLEARLIYGNELSLRQRLTEMVSPFQHFYGSANESKAFISNVLDTRNYLTHFDKKLSEKATAGIDLWKLCMKLEALFQLHFLRLMGLEIDFINGLINQNQAMKEKLTN